MHGFIKTETLSKTYTNYCMYMYIYEKFHVNVHKFRVISQRFRVYIRERLRFALFRES